MKFVILILKSRDNSYFRNVERNFIIENKLKEWKPQFINMLYEDNKTTEKYLCEDEVNIKNEYEIGKIEKIRMMILLEK